MIDRYSLSPLKELWYETHKFSIWLKIEIHVCEALAQQDIIPRKDLDIIKKKASFNVARINEIEKETRHDVIAFLTNVAENVGDSSRYIHLGLTSSDLLDTTLAVQMKEAGKIILEEISEVKDLLAGLAVSEKDTPMIGRTHGVHAEPISAGLKFASWFDELKRQENRFSHVVEEAARGKISGAVGTYAYLDPSVESYVMKELGLKPAPVSTQIVSRDLHALFLTSIALVGSSLEKFATEIRNLHRTEIQELEEPFRPGQKGSSAMPHKKNPIICERVAGLARILRSNCLAAMENVSLWHERDITHSSVERVIIPDSTILLHYMLIKFKQVLERLDINRSKMEENLVLTQGMIFSQGLLLKLVQKGITREDAYRIVQATALEGDADKDFKDKALQSKELALHLSREDIVECFDVRHHLRNVDRILTRLGLNKEKE
jgi:adenylosuccinate lyase